MRQAAGWHSFLFESISEGFQQEVCRLNSMPLFRVSKAVMIFDCNMHKESNMLDLELRYRLPIAAPRRRRVEHHAAIMTMYF